MHSRTFNLDTKLRMLLKSDRRLSREKLKETRTEVSAKGSSFHHQDTESNDWLNARYQSVLPHTCKTVSQTCGNGPDDSKVVARAPSMLSIVLSDKSKME